MIATNRKLSEVKPDDVTSSFSCSPVTSVRASVRNLAVRSSTNPALSLRPSVMPRPPKLERQRVRRHHEKQPGLRRFQEWDRAMVRQHG